jgi:hypothetical protein
MDPQDDEDAEHRFEVVLDGTGEEEGDNEAEMEEEGEAEGEGEAESVGEGGDRVRWVGEPELMGHVGADGEFSMQLTDEDEAAIRRLMQVGLDRGTVVQVYALYGRNEELTLDCLMSMT